MNLPRWPPARDEMQSLSSPAHGQAVLPGSSSHLLRQTLVSQHECLGIQKLLKQMVLELFTKHDIWWAAETIQQVTSLHTGTKYRFKIL